MGKCLGRLMYAIRTLTVNSHSAALSVLEGIKEEPSDLHPQDAIVAPSIPEKRHSRIPVQLYDLN